MKWLPRFLFAITLLLAGCNPAKMPQTPKPFDVTPQRKATHMIVLYDGFRGRGLCTATAIGPHALLTATHCNEIDQNSKIRIDIALTDFHIQKTLKDGRDHDIYLIDGPAFQNFVDYKVRPSAVGEHVYLYGDGEGQFPSRRLDGKRLAFDDPSEVDQREGVSQFSMKVVHGDSGSAVFSDDGSIVAVSTYLWVEKGQPDSTVDFTPGFTDEQIAEAVSFAPAPVWTAPVKAAQPKQPSLLDLFGKK